MKRMIITILLKFMKEKLVNKKYAKIKEYWNVINSIEKTGKCPFCPENFKYHKKPIYKKIDGWLITKNSWPYKNAKHHLVIIGEKHKTNFAELDEKDLKAVKKLTDWAIKKFKIKGGAITLRFGDSKYTGATVGHLHFHLISPALDKKKNAKVVYFPIG